MTNRKFYKTVFTYEVLSEEPIDPNMELDQILFECKEGDFSGRTIGQVDSELNGEEAAKTLIDQGSAPEFFRIDENGNDIDDVANNTYGQ